METNEEEFEDEEENAGDVRNARIVRGILIVAAVIIGLIAIYTTIRLFVSNAPEVSLAPPPAPEGIDVSLAERQDPDSFLVDEQGEEFKEFYGDSGGYKTGEIEPAQPPEDFGEFSNGLVTARAIFEELDAPRSALLSLLIVLEVIVVVVMFRKIEKKVLRRGIYHL